MVPEDQKNMTKSHNVQFSPLFMKCVHSQDKINVNQILKSNCYL